MKVCAVSFKECWRDNDNKWYSYGGFPFQMTHIAALFDEMTLLIVEVKPREGGILLPKAKIVPLQRPSGYGLKRKISVIFSLPYYLFMIMKYIRQADVVHTPVPGDIAFLGMLCAIVMRKRLLARYGGSWAANSTLMNRVTKAVMRFFAGGRNVMLATGEGDQPPAPGMHWIFVTALTRIEIDSVNPVLSCALNNPPVLLYLGRLSPEKGVPILIKAVAHLREEKFTPLPQVRIIGGGSQEAELKALVRQNCCEDIIQFTGQLDRRQLMNALKEGDLCVQPSLTEGFSKAWLDAMTHGIPVISSEVGAARSVIGQSGERGWLVAPGDVASLVNTLKIVLQSNIDWFALRQRCRHFVEGRTLEAWQETIGRICAEQWNLKLVEGKLR